MSKELFKEMCAEAKAISIKDKNNLLVAVHCVNGEFHDFQANTMRLSTEYVKFVRDSSITIFPYNNITFVEFYNSEAR